MGMWIPNVMDLQEFFKNKYSIYGGLALAKIVPRRLGYAAAKLVGNRIAKQKPRVYRQLRENLSHIPGTTDRPGQLDQITKQAFINAGRYYYDFYHSIGKPVEKLKERIHIPDEVFTLNREAQARGRGVQLAGIHMGNFDLGMVTLAGSGLELQALSASNPNEGYEVQNKLRSGYDFVVTPISPASLRQAIQRLRDGGVVAVGLDWPHPEETMLSEVFGEPAYIPLGTARLAFLGNAVTMIIAFYSDEQGQNYVLYSDPIEVIRTGDRDEDIRQNTNAYIRVFEDFLQKHPDQWLRYHKFWSPETEAETAVQQTEKYSRMDFRKESFS